MMMTFSKSSDVLINSKELGMSQIITCCNNSNEVGAVQVAVVGTTRCKLNVYFNWK
jgi:hypothetical protein